MAKRIARVVVYERTDPTRLLYLNDVRVDTTISALKKKLKPKLAHVFDVRLSAELGDVARVILTGGLTEPTKDSIFQLIRK